MILNMKLIIIIITLSISLSCFSQKKEIDYNESILLEYAILGIKEYNLVTSYKSEFTKDYDINNYFNFGRIIKDCNGINKKIVLFAFESKSGGPHASIYLILSDGLFASFLSRGYSIRTPKDEIEYFKQLKDGDYLFHCGL